jgi:non-specific serine/threonine protein kinase
VLASVAATLGIQERGLVTLKEAVAQALSSSASLLVLDNCEHVLDSAAELTATLLAQCPGLHILATSRERLGVRGEWLFDLAPLPTTPGPHSRSDAALLFELRARAVCPGFDAGSDPEGVRRVCEHLDGLPLAIELAASRLRGLSLRDIDARLADRFALLRSGHRDDAGRHRTLEAVVEWSHETLPMSDRAVFNRLAVFGDSFSLAAAERVVSSEPVQAAEVADCLLRLVDKSLVVRVADAPSTRYRVLETLRQFGRARLIDAGTLARYEDRLLDWALDVVAGLERDMRTTRQDAALRDVLPDHGNLRAALDVALARHDDLAALRIVTSVPLATPGQRADLIDRILARATDLPPVAVGRALLAVANLSFTRATQERGIAAARQAADLFAVEGDARLVSWSHFFELFCHWGLNDVDRALHAA